MFSAGEVLTAGDGGLAAVSEITGVARSTIGRGRNEIEAAPLCDGRMRRAGGGRNAVVENDATLLDDLKRLVEPATMGDPAARCCGYRKAARSSLAPWPISATR